MNRHGLLALSALHIAQLRPDSQILYWQRAELHYGHAAYGQESAVANVSEANADALSAFTLLIVYLAFAMPERTEGTQNTPLQETARCLHTLRGIRPVGAAISPFLQEGLFKDILNVHPGSIKGKPNFDSASTEAHFAKLLVFASANVDVDQDHEVGDIESYAAAASSLRASFLQIEVRGEPVTGPIWQWAIRLPASFVTRLAESHSVPLILVAHWCVLLHDVNHYWWIRGWIDHTIDRIASRLLPEHRDWLQWPKQRLQELRST